MTHSFTTSNLRPRICCRYVWNSHHLCPTSTQTASSSQILCSWGNNRYQSEEASASSSNTGFILLSYSYKLDFWFSSILTTSKFNLIYLQRSVRLSYVPFICTEWAIGREMCLLLMWRTTYSLLLKESITMCLTPLISCSS
jgi:hypothetical protein